MRNSLVIFENSLSSQKEQASELLEDLTFNLAVQKLAQNTRLDTILNEFLKVLYKLEMLDNQNTTKVVKALIKAKIQNEQNALYALLSEMELLKSKIKQQKNSLKNEVSQVFYELKQGVKNSNFQTQISNSIDDAFLFELENLDILKETAESAFITTLEKGCAE